MLSEVFRHCKNKKTQFGNVIATATFETTVTWSQEVDMERDIYTVTPKNGQWEIQKGNSPVQTFDRQEEAIQEGRKIAREKWEKEGVPSQLRIKGEDGRFRDESTYGDDPQRYPS
jgi:hypothetical protein